MSEFQRTGNEIPIDKKEALKYVVDRLTEYNNNIENGIYNETNPYIEPIYLNLSNSKMVEVPDEIKKDAIKIVGQKYQNIEQFKTKQDILPINETPFVPIEKPIIRSRNEKSELNEIKKLEQIDRNLEKKLDRLQKTIEKDEEQFTITNAIMQMTFCIIFIIALLFILSRFKN